MVYRLTATLPVVLMFLSILVAPSFQQEDPDPSKPVPACCNLLVVANGGSIA